jgi:adenylyltransferase/sulfurtransferase
MNLEVEQDLLRYGPQLAVLGRKGQEKLRGTRVHVSGTGRIGTAVVLALAAEGIGAISVNDPQRIEPENVGACIFVGSGDLGKQKVAVLRRTLRRRQDLAFETLAARTESRAVDSWICRSDLIVSCANTLEARFAAERKAIRYRKPILQVAAFDGRDRLGGMITLRRPTNRWSACFGCLAEEHEPQRGEGLLPTVTSTLAAVASTMATQILTGQRCGVTRTHNLFYIDLEHYAIEALAVERRIDCAVCGARSDKT